MGKRKRDAQKQYEKYINKKRRKQKSSANDKSGGGGHGGGGKTPTIESSGLPGHYHISSGSDSSDSDSDGNNNDGGGNGNGNNNNNGNGNGNGNGGTTTIINNNQVVREEWTNLTWMGGATTLMGIIAGFFYTNIYLGAKEIQMENPGISIWKAMATYITNNRGSLPGKMYQQLIRDPFVKEIEAKYGAELATAVQTVMDDAFEQMSNALYSSEGTIDSFLDATNEVVADNITKMYNYNPEAVDPYRMTPKESALLKAQETFQQTAGKDPALINKLNEDLKVKLEETRQDLVRLTNQFEKEKQLLDAERLLSPGEVFEKSLDFFKDNYVEPLVSAGKEALSEAPKDEGLLTGPMQEMDIAAEEVAEEFVEQTFTDKVVQSLGTPKNWAHKAKRFFSPSYEKYGTPAKEIAMTTFAEDIIYNEAAEGLVSASLSEAAHGYPSQSTSTPKKTPQKPLHDAEYSKGTKSPYKDNTHDFENQENSLFDDMEENDLEDILTNAEGKEEAEAGLELHSKNLHTPFENRPPPPPRNLYNLRGGENFHKTPSKTPAPFTQSEKDLVFDQFKKDPDILDLFNLHEGDIFHTSQEIDLMETLAEQYHGLLHNASASNNIYRKFKRRFDFKKLKDAKKRAKFLQMLQKSGERAKHDLRRLSQFSKYHNIEYGSEVSQYHPNSDMYTQKKKVKNKLLDDLEKIEDDPLIDGIDNPPPPKEHPTPSLDDRPSGSSSHHEGDFIDESTSEFHHGNNPSETPHNLHHHDHGGSHSSRPLPYDPDAAWAKALQQQQMTAKKELYRLKGKEHRLEVEQNILKKNPNNENQRAKVKQLEEEIKELKLKLNLDNSIIESSGGTPLQVKDCKRRDGSCNPYEFDEDDIDFDYDEDLDFEDGFDEYDPGDKDFIGEHEIDAELKELEEAHIKELHEQAIERFSKSTLKKSFMEENFPKILAATKYTKAGFMYMLDKFLQTEIGKIIGSGVDVIGDAVNLTLEYLDFADPFFWAYIALDMGYQAYEHAIHDLFLLKPYTDIYEHTTKFAFVKNPVAWDHYKNQPKYKEMHDNLTLTFTGNPEDDIVYQGINPEYNGDYLKLMHYLETHHPDHHNQIYYVYETPNKWGPEFVYNPESDQWEWKENPNHSTEEGLKHDANIKSYEGQVLWTHPNDTALGQQEHAPSVFQTDGNIWSYVNTDDTEEGMLPGTVKPGENPDPTGTHNLHLLTEDEKKQLLHDPNHVHSYMDRDFASFDYEHQEPSGQVNSWHFDNFFDVNGQMNWDDFTKAVNANEIVPTPTEVGWIHPYKPEPLITEPNYNVPGTNPNLGGYWHPDPIHRDRRRKKLNKKK